ncbi:MAG: hypothetical protein LUE29_09575 [Lachnospiraceae bacterium]|nr:hypothetical protein [Lachnospiraceae bacterium]
MNKLAGAVIFAAGTAIGVLATWHFAKTKYEKIAEEEIAEVKQTYRVKITGNGIRVEKVEEKEPVDDKTTYGVKIAESGYGRISVDEETNDHYVISPEEFGEMADYDNRTLLYFQDGVLTDDNYEVVDDVDEIVGEEALKSFGEYEDDSVYVRNDRTKCDYEILLNLDTYRNVAKTLPPHRRRT